MERKELELWLRRADIVGRAQERYLWLLLIAGVFFLAVEPPAADAQPIPVPILGLPLHPGVVWAVGPAVLGFLVVAALGSLRAYRTVEDTLRASDVKFIEAFDSAPNALDFAFYTTRQSPLMLRKLFLFVYPTYFALFVLEGLVLLGRQVTPWPSAPDRPLLWAAGAVTLVWGLVRVLKYWHRNLGRAGRLF